MSESRVSRAEPTKLRGEVFHRAEFFSTWLIPYPKYEQAVYILDCGNQREEKETLPDTYIHRLVLGHEASPVVMVHRARLVPP